MGIPSRRSTSSSKRQRASHFALRSILVTKCSKCKKPILPHHACRFCGTYAGKEVIDVKSKLDKQKRKRKDRGQKPKEEEESKKQKTKTKT